MLKTIVSVLILYVHQNTVSSTKPKQECGYKQCPPTRDGALNVHLIPHSHMDAGWVKTFDEYYYGTKTSVSTANVQLIYHTVMSELLHDKRRKFTFSEAAYFWRWWKEQRPATRATFRSLVQEGRIEFAGGGWVQNDEATVDYDLIIDQFTWGLRKINDTVGPCGKPRAAWQIDAYGHTREQASLLAQMGYDGLFIGRVDHRLREAMIDEDRMEFMWRGSDVLGKMSDIMTHTLYNLYNAPEGFCFDFLCSDEPIVDDPDSKVYNAEKRVNDFILQIERQAKYYEHDNLIVTMGGDFTYQGAANWFMNMDKLINHVNTHPANITDVNIFYSTPSCFLKAIYLYGRRNKAIYTEKGDHIPYGSDVNTYWTGYYSSRPALKLLVRKAASFLRVIKQLTVLARLGDSYELHLLRHAVNLVLHHDGITGTSQQHVANDFVRILSEAIDTCTKKISYLLSSLTPTWGWSRRSKTSEHFTVCHELNMTQCQFTESQEAMMLMVYNPSTVKTYHHVRIPGVALHYSIRDYNDEEVEYQLVPLPAAIINMPGRSSSAIQELCFEAENVPPLGFSAYYISPVRDQLEEMALAKKITKGNEPPDTSAEPNIANEYLKVYVDKDTGLMKMIQHIDGTKLEIAQNFHYYSPSQQGLQSGAYSFRPERSRPTPVSDKAAFTIVSGPIVKEIRQRFSDWVTQVIRLHRGEEFVELDWTVGPVPIGTDLGKEIVSLFQTNISHKGEFYTDSNGRHMIQRTCWNYTGPPKKKPVPACYYPVTSRICIHAHNASAALCVLPDRAQGGASYQDGEIELMVHRRLLTDDGFGLEESLNEEAYGVGLVVRGKHRLYISNHMQEQDGLSFNERMSAAARRWRYEPWLFFTPGEKINRRKWQSIRTKRFTALRLHGVPRHVHVLTLEPWKAGSVLLRLENTRTSQDHEAGRGHVTVHLRKLFLHMKVVAVRETTLAGNQWLDDARQMDWSTRYVYDGADDDILPEDQMEYRKDTHNEKEEVREDPPLSEEDPSYQKQKASKRLPPRERSRMNYNRQKRSLNESIGQNIINGTFNYSNDAETKCKSCVNNSEFTQDFNIKMPKFNNFNDTYSTYVPESSLKLAKSNLLRVKKKSPKLSFLSTKTPVWAKHAKMEDERLSDEVTSDEEDYAAIVRRNRKKKKDRKILASSFSGFTETDDVDDGVTKSIYEMYYKVKPRQASFKPRGSQERHDAPETTRNKNKKNTQDSGENMKNRRKKIKDTEDSAEIRRNSRKNIKNTEDSSEVEKNRRRMAKNPGDSAEMLKNRRKMSKNAEHSAEIVAKRRKMSKNTEDSGEMLNNRRKMIKNTEDSGEALKNKRKMAKHAEGSAEVENKEYGERGSGEDVRKNNSKSKNKRRKPMSSDSVDMPFFLTGNSPAQKKTQPRPGMSDSGEDRTQGLGTQFGTETLRRELSDLRVNQRARDDYDTPVEDEEEKELDRDYRQTVHRRNRSRQRRSPDELPTETASEQEADEAGEFVATLRPTQIRTFVVWLEPPKKPYII